MDLLENYFNRPSGAGVGPALTGVVFLDATGGVGGDAGVEGAVGTTDSIDEPHALGPAENRSRHSNPYSRGKFLYGRTHSHRINVNRLGKVAPPPFGQ